MTSSLEPATNALRSLDFVREDISKLVAQRDEYKRERDELRSKLATAQADLSYWKGLRP